MRPQLYLCPFYLHLLLVSICFLLVKCVFRLKNIQVKNTSRPWNCSITPHAHPCIFFDPTSRWAAERHLVLKSNVLRDSLTSSTPVFLLQKLCSNAPLIPLILLALTTPETVRDFISYGLNYGHNKQKQCFRRSSLQVKKNRSCRKSFCKGKILHEKDI